MDQPTDVVIKQVDCVNVKIVCEPSIGLELNDHFTFEAPGAKFHPLYRNKLWDGKIRLYHPMSGLIYRGLASYVELFAEANNYTVSYDEGYITDGELVTEDKIKEYCNELSLSLPENGTVYDYQLDAIYRAISDGRKLLVSPTGSGKSLIIYCLVRWYLNSNKKILILVPTVSLVEQLYADFIDYSKNNNWNVKENCGRVYSGQDKNQDKNIIISTWQSAYKLPQTFFNNFDCFFGDEAHLFKAKSLVTIMNRCKNISVRIGTTGTLDGAKVNKLVLEGLFGPVYKVTTTRKLMDDKQLAELKIYSIVLNYKKEIREALYKKKKSEDNKEKRYQVEINFIIQFEKRNKFIKNLALKQDGNTLVLFQFVEKHGKILYDMISSEASDRKVFFISGNTEALEREEIRKITEGEQNAIIVASNGTFATGINIRNLHNIIFASPSKSRVRNLQSIGRGLRISSSKTVCKLYDIGDDLTWKDRQNYTLLHMIERLKIYNEEQLDYQLIKVDI